MFNLSPVSSHMSRVGPIEKLLEIYITLHYMTIDDAPRLKVANPVNAGTKETLLQSRYLYIKYSLLYNCGTWWRLG